MTLEKQISAKQINSFEIKRVEDSLGTENAAPPQNGFYAKQDSTLRV